jgi:hypothetical protein
MTAAKRALKRLLPAKTRYEALRHRKFSSRLAHGRHILLAGLCLIFLLFSALLVVAQQLAHQRSGFDVGITNQNVLTYAPTAIMIILVAAWRQVDYSYKRLTPWSELDKREASAERSILLDYISPFQLITFYRSLKNGHHAVALGIVGFLLLRAATIASTGLLVLEAKTTVINLTARTRGPFNETLNTSTGAWWSDPSPGFTTYGILTAGLEPPFGTTSEAAYSAFSLPDNNAPNLTFAITLDAVFPTVKCEVVEILSTDLDPPDWTMSFNSSLCDASDGPKTFTYVVDEPQPPAQKLVGATLTPSCKNFTDGLDWSRQDLQFVLLAEILYEKSPGQASNNTTVAYREIPNIQGVICQTSYVTGKVNVSGTSNNFPFDIQVQRMPAYDTRTDDALSGMYLGEMVTFALMAGPGILGSADDNSLFRTEMMSDAALDIISSYGNGTDAGLFSDKALSNSAEATFTNIATQLAGKYLASDRYNDTAISLISTESSVRINELSTWLMFSAFLLTLIIGIILLSHQSHLETSIGTETILDIGRIVHGNHSLAPLHSAMCSRSEDYTRRYLTNYNFRTDVATQDTTIQIVAAPAEGKQEPENVAEKCSYAEWWTQLTLKYWFLVLTFLYSIAVVVLLEVLQRLSDDHHGLCRSYQERHSDHDTGSLPAGDNLDFTCNDVQLSRLQRALTLPILPPEVVGTNTELDRETSSRSISGGCPMECCAQTAIFDIWFFHGCFSWRTTHYCCIWSVHSRKRAYVTK